jgi:predicted dehydrogenase
VSLGSGWSVSCDSASRYARSWSIFNDTGGYQWGFGSPDELGVEMYRNEMAHFLHCVRTGQQPFCPLSDGLRVLEVCEKIEAMTAVQL